MEVTLRGRGGREKVFWGFVFEVGEVWREILSGPFPPFMATC